jgi:hypothetical protein
MAKADNIEEVIKAIKIKSIELGDRKAFAEACNTPYQYVGKVVQKIKPPSERILNLIGYKLSYVKVLPGEKDE